MRLHIFHLVQGWTYFFIAMGTVIRSCFTRIVGILKENFDYRNSPREEPTEIRIGSNRQTVRSSIPTYEDATKDDPPNYHQIDQIDPPPYTETLALPGL